MAEVASRLTERGHSNPHWAPQSLFCGGTVGRNWTSYTHHIPLHNLTAGLVDALDGALPAALLGEVRAALLRGNARSHVTHASAYNSPSREAPPASRQSAHALQVDRDQREAQHVTSEVYRRLFEFYFVDYMTLHSHGLLQLRPSFTAGAK